MARARENKEMDWAPVVGRALAFLCLHYADLRSKSLPEQEAFLKRFGLPRSEAAAILGSTKESLAELERRKKQETGAKPRGRRPKTQAKARTDRGRKR